jgi:glycerol-3-phosphate dehydrogenase
MESRSFDVMAVGGGAAGAAITRDLSMRGFDVVLIERNKVASGSSSASHQNLVGGLRYVVKNPTVAAECAEENRVLSRMAPELIGERFNYFVGFRDEYVEAALRAAASLGVRADEVDLREAFREVPGLSKDVDIVVETDDRNLDVRTFCLLNCSIAKQEGAVVFEDATISSIKRTGDGFLICAGKGEFKARYVVNATGPWLNAICEKVGVKVPLIYSQGTIVVQKSLSPRGLQFFHKPSDGDAYIVHNGEAWLGTTSTTINCPESAAPEPWAEEYLKERFSTILPKVKGESTRRRFVGVRALLGNCDSENGRSLSRDFTFLEEPEGFFNVVTGKLTLARLVAERVSDEIADREGRKTRCRTDEELIAFDEANALGNSEWLRTSSG